VLAAARAHTIEPPRGVMRVARIDQSILRRYIMYYGFEYADGTSTTTGESNEGAGLYRGRLSIAGDGQAFETKKQRDTWVNRGCNSYGGRIAVSIRKLRYLCRGMTAERFTEYMGYLQFAAVQNE